MIKNKEQMTPGIDTNMPALPGYYTTKEAAEKLGYASTSTLAGLCQQGKIIGVMKVGKTWLIPEKWVIEQMRLTPKRQGNRGATRK